MAIVTNTKVGVKSIRRDKLIHRKIVVAMVASCKQIGIIPNDNPIGLDIGNEIICVPLGRSGHTSELWLARHTMDSHDLKTLERVNLIVHNNTLS